MSRHLALFSLIFGLIGCAFTNPRGQGPFASRNTVAPPQSPLAIATPAPLPAPVPPGPPDQMQVVPPRPQTAGGPDGDVVPAGGLVTQDPNLDRRRLIRREPKPGDLPSPIAPPDSPPSPAPAAPGVPQDAGLVAAKRLAQTATAKWKTVDTYEAHLTRRESMGGAPAVTEEIQYLFRKEPMAVYMRNVGDVGRGREVLYNPSKFKDEIHVVVGEGDTRFLRPGSRAPSLSPDSPQVKSKSRHSIREAGFGTPITRFAKLVGDVEAGNRPPETFRYIGRVRRQEFGDLPLEQLEQIVRPGDDPLLPGGGTRHWFFLAAPESPGHGLPVLMILYEKNPKQPREVEYYCFTKIVLPARLTDADFDLARLGKKP